MFMFILIQNVYCKINGYNPCEDWCYNHTCYELNGDTSKECGECSSEYGCNYKIDNDININNIKEIKYNYVTIKF